jgi:radical SAM protein with 4Fe4S-binding SPASM domain
LRQQIFRWAEDGLLKRVATDYSGDILWADTRFGGDDLDFLLGLRVPFHLDTNGVCLYPETSKRLMESTVSSINVSLDAARDETFRRIRKGAPPLNQIIENMKSLAFERKRASRLDVRLSTSFTVMRSNINELSEFIALAHDAGFDLVLARHVECYTSDMAGESLWHDKALFNRTREEALKAAETMGIEVGMPPAFDQTRPATGHNICLEPWRSAVVLANGDVQACCVPGPEMWMGNLNKQTMKEIWNGPRYQELRRSVNSDHPPLACSACPILRKTNNPESYMPFTIRQQIASADMPPLS